MFETTNWFLFFSRQTEGRFLQIQQEINGGNQPPHFHAMEKHQCAAWIFTNRKRRPVPIKCNRRNCEAKFLQVNKLYELYIKILKKTKRRK